MAEIICKEHITSTLERKLLLECKICEKNFACRNTLKTQESSDYEGKEDQTHCTNS